MNDELTQFIANHKNTALIVIRKSPWYSKLDSDEIDEVLMCGLWKVWETHDPSKSSLGRFICVVLSRYILRLIRKKTRIQNREVELFDLPYEESENVEEYFTESEWECVKPIWEGNSLKEAAAQRGFLPCHYRTLTKSLAHFRGER